MTRYEYAISAGPGDGRWKALPREPVRFDGDDVHIPLTQGQWTVVSLGDFDKVGGRAWYARKSGTGKFYASYKKGVGKHGNFCVHMHRVIMDAPLGMEVDHIDGNSLNNRRSNLRVCTTAENRKNTRITWGKSGIKGVHWCSRTKRWIAKISANHKPIYVGVFKDKWSAAIAYNEAAKKYHGEFAALNVIGPVEYVQHGDYISLKGDE